MYDQLSLLYNASLIGKSTILANVSNQQYQRRLLGKLSFSDARYHKVPKEINEAYLNWKLFNG